MFHIIARALWLMFFLTFLGLGFYMSHLGINAHYGAGWLHFLIVAVCSSGALFSLGRIFRDLIED